MSEIRKESGFSILEMMIAIAIMGILVVIAIPAYRTYSVKAKASEAVNHMATIRSLQVFYKATYDTYLQLPANPPGNVPTSYLPWGNPGGNWDKLDFAISKRVRYQYSAAPGTTGDISSSFKLTAQTDFDGAGPPDDTWTMTQDRIITHTNRYK